MNVSCLLDITNPQNSTKSLTFTELQQCINQDDLIGNFKDCRKYQKCIDGQLVYFDCPRGLLFDTIKRECISEKKARCLNSNPFSNFNKIT